MQLFFFSTEYDEYYHVLEKYPSSLKNMKLKFWIKFIFWLEIVNNFRSDANLVTEL